MKSREQRFREAQERQEAYDAMTTIEKINYLNAKFGLDKGAKRERLRLAARLAIENSKPKKKNDARD
jgi:hypothetical protein